MVEWPDVKRGPAWRLIRRIAKFHVVAFVQTGDNMPVFVDPTGYGMFVKPVTQDHMTILSKQLGTVDSAVVECRHDGTPFPMLQCMSCVSVVKRLVGMHDWTVITPKQLMRKLHTWERRA